VPLPSETHLKPHNRFSIPNYHFHRTDHFPGRKGETVIAARKGIPHNHIDLPPLVSTEATVVCKLAGNSEVLFAAVYKSPGHAWNDVDTTKLLSFRRKSLLAGDLNAKHQFWHSIVSNPSGVKLLNLLHIYIYIYIHIYEFEISAPQRPTHYSPAKKGGMLDIAVHKNIRLSESLSLTFWTQITYQLLSTNWNILELGIF
jgi:hypothetical protein